MLMGMMDSYLVAHLGLTVISGVSSSWQYYHDLPGDFHRSGSRYSSVISKSLGQKNQSMLAYHVTEALKITIY